MLLQNEFHKLVEFQDLNLKIYILGLSLHIFLAIYVGLNLEMWQSQFKFHLSLYE
jgi:hypothetical protein